MRAEPRPAAGAGRRTPRRPLASLAALLILAVPASGQWPQWRGPEGLGVAPEGYALPESWEPGAPNIRWRTEIPGEGISSPVVGDGRVFLTTAYEGGDTFHWWLAAGAAIGLALVFLRLARGRRREGAAPAPRFVRVLSYLFVALGLVMVLAPELYVEPGNTDRAWRVAGAVSLIGVAAAFGWFRRGSPGRLLGTFAVAAAAAALVYWMPRGPLGPQPAEKSLLFLPGLALGIWLAVSFWRARRSGERGRAGWPGAPLAAAALLLLALVVFVPANFLHSLQRVVVAVDLASGEILWEEPVLSGPPEQKWQNNTYATPTPVTDGEVVVSYFGHGIAALDSRGELLWRHRFPEYAGHTRYGAGASPILDGDQVILAVTSESFQEAPPSWIAAYDKRTGEERWRIVAEDAHDSYATPMLAPTVSGAVLLMPSFEGLVAYDPETGRRLWRQETAMDQIVASPARAERDVALTGGAHGPKLLRVIRLAAGPDADPEILWESRRSVPTVASPVFYRGRLYTITAEGIMSCYEAETGEVLWRERLPADQFSSLMAGDGRVYATNRDGTTSVVAAASDFELLATNQLEAPVFASPAAAEGCLLLRTAAALYCIEPAA